MIYAVIVNYNSGDGLREIAYKLTQVGVEVVTVDNASKDNSLWSVEGKIIMNSMNALYSRAANMGIRFALERGASHVLLINTDLDLSENFLDYLMSEAHSAKGIIAPIIKYEKSWSKGGKLNLKKGIVEHYV